MSKVYLRGDEVVVATSSPGDDYAETDIAGDAYNRADANGKLALIAAWRAAHTTGVTAVVPVRAGTAVNALTFFKDPSEGALLAIDPSDVPTLVNVATPGYLEKKLMKSVSDELWKAVQDVMGGTDQKNVSSFYLAGIQDMITYSTSKKSFEPNKDKGVMVSERNITLPYGKWVNPIVAGSGQAGGVENPVRQYARSLSTATVSLISAGHLKPNMKLVSKYGVPAEYIPFYFDYCIPDVHIHGLDAVLAQILARSVALRSSTGARGTSVHSAFELSSGGVAGILNQ